MRTARRGTPPWILGAQDGLSKPRISGLSLTVNIYAAIPEGASRNEALQERQRVSRTVGVVVANRSLDQVTPRRADHYPMWQRPRSSQAASFTLGLSPARDAKRTSMSKLNCPILPRLISDTRACVIPSALAAWVCVRLLSFNQCSSPLSSVERMTISSASAFGNRS